MADTTFTRTDLAGSTDAGSAVDRVGHTVDDMGSTDSIVVQVGQPLLPVITDNAGSTDAGQNRERYGAYNDLILSTDMITVSMIRQIYVAFVDDAGSTDAGTAVAIDVLDSTGSSDTVTADDRILPLLAGFQDVSASTDYFAAYLVPGSVGGETPGGGDGGTPSPGARWTDIDDVRTIWDGSRTDAQLLKLIVRAETILLRRVPDLADRVADGRTTTAMISIVVSNVVARYLRNPAGYRSETAGEVSYSFGSGGEGGQFRFTDADLADLGISTVYQARSIRMSVPNEWSGNCW